MSTITLYRGDAEKIKEFDFNKTNKRCLVGQGIYLTTKKNVAETYRTKGHYERYSPNSKVVLFQGRAATKQHAQEIAYGRYVTEVLKKKIQEATSFDHYQFLDKIEEGLIEVKIDRSTVFDKTQPLSCNYTYHKEKPKQVGYISEFNFPERLFNDSMLMLDRTTPEEYLKMFFDWECVADKIEVIIRENSRLVARRDPVTGSVVRSWEHDERRKIIQIEKSADLIQVVKHHHFPYRKLNYQRMRVMLEEYGYRGLEYPGGMITNNIRHRAFCVWDEDFVNDHKVKRYK